MYTVAEVAKQMGCIPCWVRVLCQQGRLHAVKVGRDWVILDIAVKGKMKVPRKKRAPNKNPHPATLRPRRIKPKPDKYRRISEKFWANGLELVKKNRRTKYEDWEVRAARGLPDDEEE